LVKIKPKAIKKTFDCQKARLRACPELKVTRTAMADCLGLLGHQKLTKENLQ
jgi:hypothetical protein